MQAQLADAKGRQARLEQELAVRAVRREAEAAHATRVAALEAEAAARLDTAVREARDDAARVAAETAQPMAQIAGAVVLAGVAGTAIGWLVSLSGILR